jgi:hypothetical protein
MRKQKRARKPIIQADIQEKVSPLCISVLLHIGRIVGPCEPATMRNGCECIKVEIARQQSYRTEHYRTTLTLLRCVTFPLPEGSRANSSLASRKL